MKIPALVLLFAFAGHGALLGGLSAAPMSFAHEAQTSDGCEIPDVIGLTRSAADALLKKSGLSAGRVDTKWLPESPAGIVIAQEPRCQPRPRDGRIHLVVSSAPPPEAPRPEGAGGGGTSIGDVAVPIGIAAGAAVLGAILSRRGQDRTTVPNLVNLPEGAVVDVLTKARLQTGEVARQESTAVAAGRVISQTPAAGTVVAPASAVSVRISTGLPMTVVPDLAGLDWQNANARTTGARLRILVTDPQASDVAGMTVASQVPAAGTRVAVGAAVGVTLRGAQPQQPPPPTPPVAPQPAPPVAVQPTPAPSPPAPPAPVAPAPAAPAPVAQVPAPPAGPAPPLGGPALPTAQQPEATIAQVLPPPLPVVPPVTPVIPAAPTAPTIWLWPLFLLLLLAVVPARDRIRKRLSRTAVPPASSGVPPMVPRVTFIPRLDAGRQAIISRSQELRGGLDLVYHVNGGIQRARFDDDVSGTAPTAAGS